MASPTLTHHYRVSFLTASGAVGSADIGRDRPIDSPAEAEKVRQLLRGASPEDIPRVLGWSKYQ